MSEARAMDQWMARVLQPLDERVEETISDTHAHGLYRQTQVESADVVCCKPLDSSRAPYSG